MYHLQWKVNLNCSNGTNCVKSVVDGWEMEVKAVLWIAYGNQKHADETQIWDELINNCDVLALSCFEIARLQFNNYLLIKVDFQK